MTYEEFAEWLEELEVQTLTDELKRSILEKVGQVCADNYDSGSQNTKDNIINYIENNL